MADTPVLLADVFRAVARSLMAAQRAAEAEQAELLLQLAESPELLAVVRNVLGLQSGEITVRYLVAPGDLPGDLEPVPAPDEVPIDPLTPEILAELRQGASPAAGAALDTFIARHRQQAVELLEERARAATLRVFVDAEQLGRAAPDSIQTATMVVDFTTARAVTQDGETVLIPL